MLYTIYVTQPTLYIRWLRLVLTLKNGEQNRIPIAKWHRTSKKPKYILASPSAPVWLFNGAYTLRDGERQARLPQTTANRKISIIKSEEIMQRERERASIVARLLHFLCLPCAYTCTIESELAYWHWNGKLIIGDNLQHFLPVSFGNVPFPYFFRFIQRLNAHHFLYSFYKRQRLHRLIR